MEAVVFPGEGELAKLCRSFDWAATPLGPVTSWPASLRTTVSIVSATAFPSIVLWGPELMQIYNDAYARIMGEKHPWGLGKPTREVWPEVWHINEPIYDRVWRGETVSFENQLYPLRRHGPERPLEDVYLTISYSPVREEAGDIAGVLVTMFDTTREVAARGLEIERDALLDELSEERTKLGDVFRLAPSFLAVLSGPSHVFEMANDAYYQLIGSREIIGKPIREALPEVRSQGFIDLLDKVLETGEPFIGREVRVTLARSQGAATDERYVNFVYQRMRGSGDAEDGVLAHGSDVTEQVLARREVEHLLAESERTREALETANAMLEEQQEEMEVVNQQLHDTVGELAAQTTAVDAVNAALRAAEQRLRDVFEQAPVAVAVLTGPDHVYTLVSPRYAESPGAGRALIGRSVRDAFPELEGQGFFETMDHVYATGEPFFANERGVLIDRDRDGSPEEFFFDVGYQPLRDADGAVYAIASVAVEVTKQVHDRRALEAARAEAEEANRAKSQFLTTMSHELRTPLNAIAGYADLLLAGVRGALSEAQRTDVERMKRSGQHLLSLINDILNFAKIEAGQVEFDLERTPVSRLIAGLDDLVAPQVAARGLHVSILPADPSLVACGDVEKVRQVLLNLLTNAVKFTESGGEIVLATEADARTVRITVRDTGRGIAAERLATIFDPFVQVDRHLTPASQQGVGLGLAISRDLARGMGGDLTVASTLGAGSTFTLELPRAGD